MKIILKSKKEELEYTRLKITNNFVESSKIKKCNEIDIVAPTMCPICGSIEIAGEFKLNSIGGPVGAQKKFIRLKFCKNHKKWVEENKNKKIILPFFILFFSIIFLLFFLSAFFDNIIVLIIGILGMIIIPFSWLYYAFKVTKYQRNLKNYIIMQYSEPESIISIKRSDWMNEFCKLNQCLEDKLDLELVKEIKEKYHKNLLMFEIILPVLIVGTVILVLLGQIIIVWYLIPIIIVLAILFVGRDIYYRNKIYKMKALDYWI